MKRECKSKETRFEEYKKWCIEHNDMPNQHSKDPYEKSLGVWRINNRNWEPLIEFNSQYEKKYKSREERFEKYKSWCIEHGTTPNKYSKDSIEKSLGKWRNRNRNWEPLIEFNSQFEKKRKTPEERFEEYKRWCIEHEDTPSESSKNLYEKSLGSWRNNNRNWETLKRFNWVMKSYKEGNENAIFIFNTIKELKEA